MAAESKGYKILPRNQLPGHKKHDLFVDPQGTHMCFLCPTVVSTVIYHTHPRSQNIPPSHHQREVLPSLVLVEQGFKKTSDIGQFGARFESLKTQAFSQYPWQMIPRNRSCL